MKNNELPYMDPRKFLDPQFIICKFAEHEKRISDLEARLHMLDDNKNCSIWGEADEKE